MFLEKCFLSLEYSDVEPGSHQEVQESRIPSRNLRNLAFLQNEIRNLAENPRFSKIPGKKFRNPGPEQKLQDFPGSQPLGIFAD